MNLKKRPTAEDLAPLLQQFNSFHPIGKGVEEYILKNAFYRKIPKGNYLVNSGEICDSIYFIKKGLLRGYIEENNKEITTWFALENEMVAAITSFLTQVATMENIQAIEDCELYGISFIDLEKLYQKYPSFNIIGRKITELYYILSENRAYILRLHDSNKKYQLFLKSYSHLVNRVQITYIASFLGVTIETLSRVRSKVSANKKLT